MVKRFFIELTVLGALLFFCGIYGAVMVRTASTAEQTQTAPAAPALTVPAQIGAEDAATVQDGSRQTTDRVVTKKLEDHSLGHALSSRVSEFFLGLVSLLASFVESIMQALF